MLHTNIKKFIAIEGVNGAGKTTLVQRRNYYLILYVLCVKEPQDYLGGKRRLYDLEVVNQLGILSSAINFYTQWKGGDYVLADRCFLSSICYFPYFFDCSNSFDTFVTTFMLRHVFKTTKVLILVLRADQDTVLSRVGSKRCPPDYVFQHYGFIPGRFFGVKAINADQSHEVILCLWKDKKPILQIDQIRQPYQPGTNKNPHPLGIRPIDILQGRVNNKYYNYNFCKTCNQIALNFYSDINKPNRNKHQGHDIVKHPTRKPRQLSQQLIKSVVDIKKPSHYDVYVPFVGSGSEWLTSKHIGANTVGTEINADYIQLAQSVWELENQLPLKEIPQTGQRQLATT